MKIRKAEEKDWQGIYRFLSEIVKKGETYAINRDAGEEELKHLINGLIYSHKEIFQNMAKYVDIGYSEPEAEQ